MTTQSGTFHKLELLNSGSKKVWQYDLIKALPRSNAGQSLNPNVIEIKCFFICDTFTRDIFHAITQSKFIKKLKLIAIL